MNAPTTIAWALTGGDRHATLQPDTDGPITITIPARDRTIQAGAGTSTSTSTSTST